MTIEVVSNESPATTEKKARKPRGPKRTPAVLFEKPIVRATKALELIAEKLGRMKGSQNILTARDHLVCGAQYIASAMDELKAVPSDVKISTSRAPGAKVGGRPRVDGAEFVGKLVRIKEKYYADKYADMFTPDEVLQVTGNRGKWLAVSSGGATLFVPRADVELAKSENSEAS